MAYATISARDLEELDKVVYTPKESQLKGRTLFSSKKVAPGTKTYTYRVLTKRGAAKIIANRGTDVPTVDGDMKEYTQGIVAFALSANYSYMEVQEAQRAGINLDASQGEAIARLMGEFENKLIFNGNADANIKGLTNLDTAQKFKFDTAFLDDKGATNDPKVLMSQLKVAREKITHLTGYEDLKPVLALPGTAYDALDVAYNDYQPTTVLQMLQNRGWFSRIEKINELQTAGAKGAAMGVIFDNSAESTQILDAQPVTRMQMEYKDLVYKIPYLEQCGGLIVRAPQTIVQLTGI